MSAWGLSAYSSSKYALDAFHDAFRQEMRPFGVKVSLICPGTMKTALVSNVPSVMKLRWTAADPEVQDSYGQEYLQVVPRVETLMSYMVQPTTAVVNSIVGCLSAASPASRYFVGWDAFTLGVLLPYLCLPDWLMDWLLATVAGLPIPRQMQRAHSSKPPHVNS